MTIRKILFVLLLAGCHNVRAAEATPAPSWSCYFTRADVSPMCAAQRDEAAGVLYRSNQSCAVMIYEVFDGRRAIVRCRGFAGDMLDYISDDRGDFHLTR